MTKDLLILNKVNSGTYKPLLKPYPNCSISRAGYELEQCRTDKFSCAEIKHRRHTLSKHVCGEKENRGFALNVGFII